MSHHIRSQKLELEICTHALHSLSFIIYTLIVFLINLYATSGRNAPNAAGAKGVDEGGIELSSPTGIRNNW